MENHEVERVKEEGVVETATAAARGRAEPR
jgi:hypothetical protein